MSDRTADEGVRAQDEGDTIALVGMRFHARVGVLPHEREMDQPLEIDVAVDRDASRRAADDVLDYRALYAIAADVATSGVAWLEGAGAAIADRTLAEFAGRGATRVRVTLRKPHVALGGPLRHAEVTVRRSAPAGAAPA